MYFSNETSDLYEYDMYELIQLLLIILRIVFCFYTYKSYILWPCKETFVENKKRICQYVGQPN